MLADGAIVFASSVFIYWVTNKSQVTYEHHHAVFITALLYSVLSVVGARIFRTYAGVLRYSSFVDLMKLVYANTISVTLAIIISEFARSQGATLICALSVTNTLFTFLLATMLMWGLRVVVKLLFDIANADSQALRVLIYGALTGGVGLAKSIRLQRPSKYNVVGFISHEHKIKDKKLLDVPVYNVDEDIASIINKEKIQAVIVSPLRVAEFRQNTKVQDAIIGSGCKIFMASEAQEATVKNGELQTESSFVHLCF